MCRFTSAGLTEMMAPSAGTACALVWVCVVASSVFIILPVRYEVKVEVLVVVGLCLGLLQGILGPMRRISGEQNVQYAAMAAYYLPSFLAFSAAGSLSSSSDSILYYIMWCLVLLLSAAFGRAEMRVYTLTAGANQRWVLLKWMLYLAWVQVGLIWTDQKLTLCRLFCFLLSFVWFLAILSDKPQVGTLAANIKSFAEYMEWKYEDIVTIKKKDNNIISMSGINYPLVPGSNGEMVTIGNIPRRSRRVTTDDEDMMLAYSYSNLLARRYFGFHCPEENCPPVRAYALAQLQQQRAFKIIEVQLAFLHDYFFATYGHIVWSSCTSCTFCLCGEEIMTKLTEIIYPLKVVLTAIAVMIWAYVLFIVGGTVAGHKAVFHVVASLLLVLAVWFNAKPVVPFYWDSIRTAFWIDCVSDAHKFVRWCRSPHYSSRTHQQPYWQKKIGQYSLMEDYDRISWKNTIVALFKEHVLGQVVSDNIIEHYPAEEAPVRLEPSVQQSVAEWLLVTEGRPPTNGKTSLAKNGVLDDFESTLEEEAHTHTILIWHIATWYCSKFLPVQLGADSHAKVAEALSKYCAYLVAFLPELLPDHSHDAKKALQQVIEMAKGALGEERMTMEQKHEQIRGLLCQRLQQSSLPVDVSRLDTFDKGINLGLQLVRRDSIVEENHVSSWKVMADFWTETILYIAPSENAAAHIEHLAKGGEFVTHLWALLSNAGIYKRAS